MVMPMTPRPILKFLPTPSKLSSNDSFSADNLKSLPTPSSYTPFPFALTSHIPPLDSPHVHFPPTPSMTKMETTHSQASYDRRPIIVSPNICELPERGERDLGNFEEPEESYFQLSSANLCPNLPISETCKASSDCRQGSTTLSISQDIPASRTRCHSLPDRLIQTPPADFPSRASLRRLRRHTDPYPSPNPLPISQLPSLVSDHSSSDSDSDEACLSPPIQTMSGTPGHGLGISHISFHFPGGLSTTPLPAFSPGPECEGYVGVEPKPKKPKKRWSGRQHFQGQFENLAGEVDPSLCLDRRIDGVSLEVARNNTIGGDSRSFSNFYDRELEGCLAQWMCQAVFLIQ
ncbi:hypothetical protein CPB84DRAFT_874537 [Gymnopilus junonius]|uniref:Uncharacterized protein n=1 Tax=Gymnopilus junonius TaxID=109634 RepID=A0A9P5NR22_GYMJU|nr:hypothetical protein CPB84DRAFT_874537 [Gymnopilus junonius]